jgi:hypothetical protein
MTKPRGQGYDCCLTMSVEASGVKTRITEKLSDANYCVHCRAHCLNLGIVNSCQNVQEMRWLPAHCETRWTWRVDTLTWRLKHYEKDLDILQDIQEKTSGHSDASSYEPMIQNLKILAVGVVTQFVLEYICQLHSRQLLACFSFWWELIFKLDFWSIQCLIFVKTVVYLSIAYSIHCDRKWNNRNKTAYIRTTQTYSTSSSRNHRRAV